MKKIKFIYIPMFTLLLFNGLSMAHAQESIRRHFVNSSNQVGTEEFSLSTMSQSNSSRVLASQSSSTFDLQNQAQSPVAQVMRKNEISLIERDANDLEQKNLFELLDENVYEQNPIAPPEVYSRVLGNESFNRFSTSSESVVDPCASVANSVVNQNNINDISGPLMDFKSRHQFCGFEDEETIGSMYPSINFCECVREKTKTTGDSEDSLYKKVRDPDKLTLAMDIYRQSLVDKVMPAMLEDLGRMTEASNDFLSTDELSQMLYEVHSDVEDNEARSVLEGMRQGMHTCSGLGMKTMIQELFNPESSQTERCDEKSAQFLIDGFNKAINCNHSECDNYKSFADTKRANGEDPQEILSDSLTHRFSVNLIENNKIFDEGFSQLSNDEKFKKIVDTADAMTEFDSSGKPFVHPDFVNFEKRLPSEEQLLFMYEFMQNKDNEEFSAENFSDEKKIMLDELLQKLSRNDLYKDNAILDVSVSQMSADEKIQRLNRFAEKLEQDKERRIEGIEASQEYFSAEVEPVEAMKRMIINNYLYLGDNVLKDCAETRRKFGKLCASISGNGMAIFSHPDFRQHTQEMLLDEDLQKKIADISDDDDVESRSPLADQLFCHANFSSLSSDCSEQAMIEAGQSFSPTHCTYDAMWLLSDENENLNSGHTGNTQSIADEILNRAQNFSAAASVGDFRYVASKSSKSDDSYGDSSKGIDFNREVFNSSDTSSAPGSFLDNIDGRMSKDAEKDVAPVAVSPEQVESLPDTSPERKSPNTSERSAIGPQRSFSDNFIPRSQSALNEESDEEESGPSQSVKSNQDESAVVQQLEAAQELRTSELKAQLEQAQNRQQSLQSELDRLLNKSAKQEDDAHQAKLENKRRELSDLENQVQELETDIKREKAVVRQDFYPQNESGSNASASQASSVSSTGGAQKGPAPSAVAAGGSAGTARAPASTRSTQSNEGQASSKGLTNGTGANGLSLTAAQTFPVLPQTADLSSVARGLSGENYVLMDTGRPGLVEKIVFQYGPDGEVLFDESGRPVILSREVVELDEAEKTEDEENQEDQRSPASEELDALGEQEEPPSYRWSDVEELLDLK